MAHKQNINLCNASDISAPIVAAIQALQAQNSIENQAITNALQQILVEVVAVNANTDTLETQLQTLIADQIAGNLTLTQIQAGIGDLLVELQAINANTDGVEALITATNTKLDTLIAEQDKELIVTTPQKACATDNGVATDYFVRTKFVYDSETATLISETNEFSADGLSGWTVTAPTGTVVLGACEECCPTLFKGSVCDNGIATPVHYAIDTTLTVTAIKGLDGTIYDPLTYAIKGCEQCPFATVTGEIYQSGANTIDNIDVYAFPDPALNVTLTATDCLTLTLQFKDPITGANVGAAKSYTTNVGTPFTAVDVTDWETTFGIFGGAQTWAGYNWSLTGWAKNTPQGVNLLPNPLLAYDIAFTFQIKKDCGSTIVSNVSAPVIATVIQTAIADNGTNFLTPIPYTSDVTPIFPMGGIRLVEPINHPMVVYAVQGTCAGSPSLIGLQGTAVGTTIHNDGNWTMVNYERNYDNTVVTGSWAVPTGVEFRVAIVQTIGAAIGSATVGLIVPVIGVDYPAIEYIPCTDGVLVLLAVDGTTAMETVKSLRLENTNGLAIELQFNFIKSR